MEQTLAACREMIVGQEFCVLATIEGDRPRCSLMAYLADDDGRTIYMMTEAGSHKYANLARNPLVSLLIDTRAGPSAGGSGVKALTIGGRFRPVSGEQERRDILARLVERHPLLKELAARPQTVPFAIELESLLLLNGPVQAIRINLG